MNKEQIITFEDFPDSAADEDSAEAELLGEESKPKSHSLISLEFYQQFFDVDTTKVCQRLFWSMIPRPGVSYLQHHIRPKPDLYGPLWTCLTLVFSVAISGNLAIYLQLAAADENTHTFTTDFRKVSYAASAFISYILIIPMVLWGFLWWRRREHQPARSRLTLLEVVCLYGYSLAIYIPVSILLVIDIVWFRWSLVLLASGLSGIVLVSSLWPAVKGDDRKVGAIVSAVVICFHICVAVLFMMFFLLSKPPLTSNVMHSATEKPLEQGLSDAQKHPNNDTFDVRKPESDSLVLSKTEESKDGPRKSPDASEPNVDYLSKLNRPQSGKPIVLGNNPKPESPNEAQGKVPHSEIAVQSQAKAHQPEISKQSQAKVPQPETSKQSQGEVPQPKASQHSQGEVPQPKASQHSQGEVPQPKASKESSDPFRQSPAAAPQPVGQRETLKGPNSPDRKLDPIRDLQPIDGKPGLSKTDGLQNQAVGKQPIAPQQTKNVEPGRQGSR